MKKIGIVAWVGILVAAIAWTVIPQPAATAAKNNLTVGVVDVQVVLENTKEGKRAKESLKKERDGHLNTLQTKKKLLEKKQDEFDKKRLVATGEALDKLRKELEELTVEIQKMILESQNAMKQKESRLLSDILKKIRGVITKVSVERGLDLVFEKNAATYFRSEYEITDKVIALYDKTYK